MDSKPSLDTVYQAIYTLYNSCNTMEQEKANTWLIDLQKSIYGWKIADELLAAQSDINSSYFAAQMLRNKIIFAFQELPADSIDSLRNSLLQHLVKINESRSSNAIVVKQLCLAVVDLALQMTSWKDPVAGFLSQCHKIPHNVLIEILTFFPEEIETKLLRLGSNRRNEIFDEFCVCFPAICNYLGMLSSGCNNDPYVMEKVFKCLASWTVVGFNGSTNIMEIGVVQQAVQTLTNPPEDLLEKQDGIMTRVQDAATECLCFILQSIRGNSDLLNLQFFENLSQLENAYELTVTKECPEKSMNYCRVFSDLASAFMNISLVHSSSSNVPHFSIKTLDWVLMCDSHYDYEVVLVSFHFWYSLAENLFQRNDDRLTKLYEPYFGKLLSCLHKQIQMNPDNDGLLDEHDEFYSFREKVIDLIKDIAFIIGSSAIFKQMFFSMAVSNTWEQMEANLFIMYIVAKNILPDEEEIVPKAVEGVLKLPDNTHIAVRYTSVLLMGELCDWFENHPDQLVTVLDYLVYHLQNDQLAKPAASSLHSICNASRKRLIDKFGPLLHITRSMEQYNLDNDSAIAILKGISIVMSELSCDQISEPMAEICRTQCYHITNHIMSKRTQEEGNNDPSNWLDRLATIFRYTLCDSDPNSCPCLPAINEAWPVLLETLRRYKSESRIMERCCRCMRFMIRCVGKWGIFILEPLAKELIELYGKHQHSCFIYLGSVLVDEYGYDTSNWTILLQMLESLIAPTFNLLNMQDGLQQHPDIIDDLFRLCCRFIQRMPIAFMQSALMMPLLQLGLVSVSINHRDAHSSVTKFFHTMLDVNDEHQPGNKEVKRQVVEEMMEKHGETLVANLMQATVFILQFYLLADVAEILLDLLRFNRIETMRWIEKSIKSLPKETSSGAVTATEEQMQKLLETCHRAENVKMITRGLKDFAHLFR